LISAIPPRHAAASQAGQPEQTLDFQGVWLPRAQPV